ncbi:MAG: YbaN family protein [Pseudomonadota bacterium]
MAVPDPSLSQTDAAPASAAASPAAPGVAPPHPKGPAPVRLAWGAFGLLCVGFGAIGAVLPLIPTTPFLLLAAFAFARSSTRLHNWLVGHKRLGPLIRNWQRHGAIDRKTKTLSLAAMAAMPVVSVYFGMATWIVAVQVFVLAASAAFVVTRPSVP